MLKNSVGNILEGKNKNKQNQALNNIFGDNGIDLDEPINEVYVNEEQGIDEITDKLDLDEIGNATQPHEQPQTMEVPEYTKSKQSKLQQFHQQQTQQHKVREESPVQNKQYVRKNTPSGNHNERTLIPQMSSGNRMLKRRILNEFPIEFGEIKDNYGKLSDRVDRLEDEYNLSCLPFEFCNLLPQVTELRRHEIIEINGTKLLIGTERKVREAELKEYIQLIKTTIEEGEIFDDSLLEQKTLGGKTYTLLKFNSYELDTLNSVFLNIFFATYVTPSGDYRVNVGGQNV